VMREALVAHGRGQERQPMPMHLDISWEDAEIHFKAGYRNGGKYLALKMASSVSREHTDGLTTGTGMVMLWSAENEETTAALNDDAVLTDLRTAAVAALMAKELASNDTTLGILGTGVQGRRQAELHAEALKLK
jgi:ornithine cyclodeaminase/alanine dehydrogenase-like protein (mu-crystallin family)